jgi:hypothetical protein
MTKHLLVQETIRERKLDFFIVIETGKNNFSVPFLQNLSVDLEYVWYYLPPIGRSEGYAGGAHSQTILVNAFVARDICVKFHLSSKAYNFEWSFVVVYMVQPRMFKKVSLWLSLFAF